MKNVIKTCSTDKNMALKIFLNCGKEDDAKGCTVGENDEVPTNDGEELAVECYITTPLWKFLRNILMKS